jgi:hypothetical protein
MTARARLLAGFLSIASGAILGADRPFLDEPSLERDDVEEGPAWSEGGFALPPYPQPGDLVEFPVDNPGSPFRYALDARHLGVGDDGVVRYTLVVSSPSGARNVSVEGIRCDQKEFKVYAYGTGRGTLRPVTGAGWQPIRSGSTAPHVRDLRRFFFCRPDHYVPYPKDEIVRLLSATPRRVDDPGFY